MAELPPRVSTARAAQGATAMPGKARAAHGPFLRGFRRASPAQQARAGWARPDQPNVVEVIP
jgi:hypothetical protein